MRMIDGLYLLVFRISSAWVLRLRFFVWEILSVNESSSEKTPKIKCPWCGTRSLEIVNELSDNGVQIKYWFECPCCCSRGPVAILSKVLCEEHIDYILSRLKEKYVRTVDRRKREIA